MSTFKPLFALFASTALVGCAATRVPAQVVDPAAGNQAMAAVDPRDILSLPAGATAPSVVPIPKNNYPIPIGAIFVAPDPDGTGDGKSAATPTSVKNALQIAPEGGTIVFAGGTYRGISNLKPARRVTLQAAPGEAPWIKGSIVVTTWEKDGNAWKHAGWTHKFGEIPRIGPEYLDPKFPLASLRDMVFTDGVSLQQVKTREEVGAGKFFVDETALYMGDDPAGKIVEATALKTAFFFDKAPQPEAAGSIIRGLGFCHYADNGVSFRAKDGTLENNTFAWNGQHGLSIWDAAGATLRGNTFACNSRVGLRASRTRRLKVENNLFAWNNVDRWRTAWDAAGLKITNMAYGPEDGLIFRGNVVEDNLATGLWLDIDANHAVVVNNIARRNSSIGLFFEISDTAIIAFNLAQENGTGIMVSNARNARVWNNTVVGNANNISIKESGRTNAGGGLEAQAGKVVAGTQPGAMFATTGNQFHNNILAGLRPGSKSPLLNAGGSIGPSSEMITAADFNFYLDPQTSPNTPFASWSISKIELPSWKGGEQPIEYRTFAEFQGATGYEKNGAFAGGAQDAISPFKSWAKGDFTPLPTAQNVRGAAPLPADIAQAAGVGVNVGYKGALAPQK